MNTEIENYKVIHYKSTKSSQNQGNKWVFSCFLKIFMDGDCLMTIGRLFHSLDAETVNVLSPANTLVMGYTRR